LDSPPQYTPPPVDPQIAILQQQTQQQNIDALSQGSRMDTARLAMLYGQSQLSGMSPDIKSVMAGATPKVA